MYKKIVFFSILFSFSTLCFAQMDELVYNDLGLALSNPDSVFVLDLSNKGLETLPAAVLKFSNLKKLNLSGNHISNLPYYIEELQNLEFLDISNMPILNLNDAILKISKMKNINNLEITGSGGKVLNLGASSNYKIHKIMISQNKNL